MNIKLIAIQIGDALKDRKSLKEINRVAEAIFQFPRQEFPNESITSERAKLTYDWIMSLEHQSWLSGELEQSLIDFVKFLAHDETDFQHTLLNILNDCGVDSAIDNENALERFDSHQFHSEIIKHCRKFYGQ